ncbi:ParB family chromosome partitioning protein [Deinococcus metalli]|uniref:Chromosome 2-partitioning protein ParB n=1 Tax=Deinococcus metalli TaxID=1141878 RepID=A0A7W8KCY3_9DEIO|nr:ParB/RepB/Spo0J family partition protein [Deinococcus metalli]MBB5375806.1 ParB family chromosome partitioning protein [Deinococcus metalli]GHF36890.1 putative chromosome 2-partitioning protein ParB [Deinococcus metalli]
MSQKRKGPNLGGLLGASAALLTSPDLPTRTLPVNTLTTGKGQPRRTFPQGSLESLANSIREHGVLQPLLVRPDGDGYEIVAGERRWRAAQLAGVTEVPVVIRTLSDQEARIVALVENLQRENLNVIDEVDAKLELAAATLNLTPDQARSRLIRLTKQDPGEEAAALAAAFAPLGETWQSFAKNKLRVLGWPDAVLAALRRGLPLTVASVIAGSPAAHMDRLISLAEGGASRTDLRQEVERLAAPVESPDLAATAGRRLSSRRFLASLDEHQRKEMDRWLARMPNFIRDRTG